MMYADPLEDEQLKDQQATPKKPADAPAIAPIVPPAATTNTTTSGAQASTQQQPTASPAPAPATVPPVSTVPAMVNAPTMAPAPTMSITPPTTTANITANASPSPQVDLSDPTQRAQYWSAMFQKAGMNGVVGGGTDTGLRGDAVTGKVDPSVAASQQSALASAGMNNANIAAAVNGSTTGTVNSDAAQRSAQSATTNYGNAVNDGRALLGSVQNAGGAFRDTLPPTQQVGDFERGLPTTTDWINNYLKSAGYATPGATSNITASTNTPPQFAGSDLPATGMTPTGPLDGRRTVPPPAASGSAGGANAGTNAGADGGAQGPTREEQLAQLRDQFVSPSRQSSANDVDPFSAVTTIDPNNDLRSTTITNTPDARSADYATKVDNAAGNLANVDRTKLAEDMFNTFSKETDPAYADSMRRATKAMASTGRLWSGKARSTYGDLARTRADALDTQKQKLLQQALSDSVSDQFNKTSALSSLEDKATATNERGINALRGERQYQTGQENDAFTRALAQYQTEQGTQNTKFNQNLALLNAGESGNPAGTIGALADQMAPQLDAATIAQLSRAMGSSGGASAAGGGGSGGAASSGLDPTISSLLDRILGSGVPGVQTTAQAPKEAAGGVNMNSALSSLNDPRIMEIVNALRNRAPAPTS